jgi:hypothetical protein
MSAQGVAVRVLPLLVCGCVWITPAQQADRLGDALGDPRVDDGDGDGIEDGVDPCPSDPLPTGDFDGDGTGDRCDPCPFAGADPAGPARGPGAPVTCETPGDRDGDGLTDQDEKDLHTRDNEPDTDSDGLDDGMEFLIEGTDPLEKDTDEGGEDDGPEYERGCDPLEPRDDDAC